MLLHTHSYYMDLWTLPQVWIPDSHLGPSFPPHSRK
jgi:hypothetical protein